jgi:hypothetical protein
MEVFSLNRGITDFPSSLKEGCNYFIMQFVFRSSFYAG